jgi:hypothetical protein
MGKPKVVKCVTMWQKYLQDYFNDLIKSLLLYPHPTPLEEVTRVLIGCIHRSHTVGGANDTTMMVMFVGLLCWGLRYFLYYSYRKNLMAQEFFVPAKSL